MYKENFAQMKNDKRIIGQTFYQKRKISTEFILEWQNGYPKLGFWVFAMPWRTAPSACSTFEKSSNMAKIC